MRRRPRDRRADEAAPLILKFLALIVLVFWLGWVARSALLARRLLVLETVDGKRTLARGRIPREVLHELEDVLARARATCVLELRLDGRDGVRVRVRSGSLGAGPLQQLRNVVGRYPRARLKSGAPLR